MLNSGAINNIKLYFRQPTAPSAEHVGIIREV